MQAMSQDHDDDNVHHEIRNERRGQEIEGGSQPRETPNILEEAVASVRPTAAPRDDLH